MNYVNKTVAAPVQCKVGSIIINATVAIYDLYYFQMLYIFRYFQLLYTTYCLSNGLLDYVGYFTEPFIALTW